MPVTSLAEVWIEIAQEAADSIKELSLPSRKCGLKSNKFGHGSVLMASLPSRECGLKSLSVPLDAVKVNVTSLAEVWIEIPETEKHIMS